jgi:hypothetical protein
MSMHTPVDISAVQLAGDCARADRVDPHQRRSFVTGIVLAVDGGRSCH